MSITFKLFIGAIVAFIVLNSVLTLIFGTISWLVEKFRWKAWTGLGLVGLIVIWVLYANFGDMFSRLLHVIQ